MGDGIMTEGKTADLVRRCFAAWQAGDRAVIEALLAEDFSFTSPYDDHIDRAAYFARCWPHAGKMREFRVVRLFERGNEAFILYEARFEGTGLFRNAEFFRTDGERITEVEVYFGEPALNESAAGHSAGAERRHQGGSP